MALLGLRVKWERAVYWLSGAQRYFFVGMRKYIWRDKTNKWLIFISANRRGLRGKKLQKGEIHFPTKKLVPSQEKLLFSIVNMYYHTGTCTTCRFRKLHVDTYIPAIWTCEENRELQDHPLKMTAVPIPINKFQIDISGKQTRPKRNSASR
jgi:hypothetical protein